MPSRPSRLLVSLLAVLALAVTACGGDGDGALRVTDVRARVATMEAGVGAVYLDVTNDTDRDDELVAASVAPDVAGTVEIHETYPLEEGTPHEGMTGMGGMGMRPVDGVTVPAGETVQLAPGGLHVMLLELAGPLEDGDTFEVELTFTEAGTMTVTATVGADV